MNLPGKLSSLPHPELHSANLYPFDRLNLPFFGKLEVDGDELGRYLSPYQHHRRGATDKRVSEWIHQEGWTGDELLSIAQSGGAFRSSEEENGYRNLVGV